MVFNIQPHRLICLLACTVLAASPSTFALPNDREQAIIFQSDEAEHDEVAGTLTYTGTVIMEQGSMKISADKVVVHGNRERISKIEAFGQPARFSQIPEIGAEPVDAQAKLLEYKISEDSLHLIGDASLIQAGSSLSGNQIDYDVKNSIVKAGSETSKPVQTESKKRVKMVIPPQTFTKDESENESSSESRGE